MPKKIFAILALLFSPPLFAGDFHFDATSLGQVRKNTQLQREIPANGYLGMAASESKWHLSGETNMRAFRDFERKLDDYDLYQAVLHYQAAPTWTIDSGRQLINQGFSMETLDGIQMRMTPLEHLGFTLYSGIPRNVELGDFNKNDGLLTGLSLEMRNVTGTHAALHAAWRKNDIYLIDLKQNDEIPVGANLSHQFAVKMTPMLYGIIEYDTTGKVVNTGTAGLDIYPSNRIALNLEFNYFNTGREMDRQTIQKLFTGGRLMGGRFSATCTLVPKYLDLVGNYFYQNIEFQNGSFHRGHLVDSRLQFSFDAIGLRVEPGYYFERSLGGRLHGARISLHEQFTDRLFADAGMDFTQYKKITNDNDNAVSTVGWLGYEVLKGLTVSGGFEYNKNNLFNKDARGSFRVDYHFSGS